MKDPHNFQGLQVIYNLISKLHDLSDIMFSSEHEVTILFQIQSRTFNEHGLFILKPSDYVSCRGKDIVYSTSSTFSLILKASFNVRLTGISLWNCVTFITDPQSHRPSALMVGGCIFKRMVDLTAKDKDYFSDYT
jgi:uncharacterized protein YrrD